KTPFRASPCPACNTKGNPAYAAPLPNSSTSRKLTHPALFGQTSACGPIRSIIGKSLFAVGIDGAFLLTHLECLEHWGRLTTYPAPFPRQARLPAFWKLNPGIPISRGFFRIHPQIKPYRLARQFIPPQHCANRTTLGKVRIELPVLIRLGATELLAYLSCPSSGLAQLKQPGAVTTDRQSTVAVERRRLLRTAIDDPKTAMASVMLPALLSITPSDQQGHLLQRPVTQPDVVGQRNIHAEVGGAVVVWGRVLGNEFAGYLFALADAVYLTALGVVRREIGGRLNREVRRQLASQGK